MSMTISLGNICENHLDRIASWKSVFRCFLLHRCQQTRTKHSRIYLARPENLGNWFPFICIFKGIGLYVKRLTFDNNIRRTTFGLYHCCRSCYFPRLWLALFIGSLYSPGSIRGQITQFLRDRMISKQYQVWKQKVEFFTFAVCGRQVFVLENCRQLIAILQRIIIVVTPTTELYLSRKMKFDVDICFHPCCKMCLVAIPNG